MAVQAQAVDGLCSHGAVCIHTADARVNTATTGRLDAPPDAPPDENLRLAAISFQEIKVVVSLPNQSSSPNQRKTGCGKMTPMILQRPSRHNQVLISRKLSGFGTFIIWPTDPQLSEEPCVM